MLQTEEQFQKLFRFFTPLATLLVLLVSIYSNYQYIEKWGIALLLMAAVYPLARLLIKRKGWKLWYSDLKYNNWDLLLYCYCLCAAMVFDPHITIFIAAVLTPIVILMLGIMANSGKKEKITKAVKALLIATPISLVIIVTSFVLKFLGITN